jgi:2-dehydro-3-deoxy-D-arabinonate dehydratase
MPMQFVKFRDGEGRVAAGVFDGQTIQEKIGPDGNNAGLASLLTAAADGRFTDLKNVDQPSHELGSVTLLAPIDRQEVWGAGVTYLRSKKAREDESEHAATYYDQVYQADRPELFFKATPNRVVGTGQSIRVRGDSHWTVPEPELALVLDPALRLVGYTLGNDVSARDIEGRNPLYLPQAKVYDACCSLGPTVVSVLGFPPLSEVEIRLTIERAGGVLFESSTSVARMARRPDDLIAWLGRDNVFPDGVILLTGTGIVPPDDLSLSPGDRVCIEAATIGCLINSVVRA